MATSSEGLRYVKTSTFATSHGPMYEVKLAALLLLRCKNTGRDFQIASNVEGAGALDDILLKFKPITDPLEWYTYFLQLKHKQSAMVRLSSLVGGGGNFSLKKYLKSYFGIRDTMCKEGDKPIMFNGSFEKCTFILYTNAQAENGLTARTKDVALTKVENMLRTDSENGLVIKFSPESDREVYGSIQELDDTFLEAIDFLDKLKVFTGQATEMQLDNLIKGELAIRFKGRVCIDVLYRHFEELVEEWSRSSNLILDQNCDFLDRAFVEALSVKQQECFYLNVNFAGDFWEAYNSDLTEDVSLLQIETCGLLVTNAKVVQYLRKTNTPFMFFGIDSLSSEQDNVILVWSLGSTDILVIARRGGDHKQVKQLMEKICNVLESNPKKQVVLISARNDSYDDIQLQTHLGIKFKSMKNNFRFSHLDNESKERILCRDVLFQGHSIALRCLFKKITELTETVCNAQLVETLLSNEILSIGPKLDDGISFFIPRTLNWSNVVKKEILKAEELNDVFAVSDVTIQGLQELAPESVRVVHASNPDSYSSRFVVLDALNSEADFKLLCERTTYNDVHWLYMENGDHLRWRRSHGNIDLISQCINENVCTEFHPETALHITDRTVLLVAEPGMGKTTLISHLARETKRAFPHLWIVKLNLKDHTKLLEEQSDVAKFLVSAIGIDQKSALERTFFRFSLEQEGNVVVLLDGFDEIAPSYSEEGCDLLKNLLNTRVRSVWVTSRRSMSNVLERNLSCLAFDMEKFTEADQKTFFKQYWANVETPMTNVEMDSFLSELLKLLSRSLNDKEKNFTGIPLQTMMLAEVFEEYIKNPNEKPLPEKLDLLHLFEQVIEKKFNIYVAKKSIAIDKNSAYETSELRKCLVKNHMNAALVLLISKTEIQRLHSKEKVMKKSAKFLQNIIGCHDKTGIVDSVVNGKPHFVHRTFAEYFGARWFSKYFPKNVPFLQTHLFSDHFKVIRDIFDRLLARSSELHSAILSNDISRVESLSSAEGFDVNAKDLGGRSALHLASSLEFFQKKVSENDRFIGPRPRHMTELLIEHGAEVNSEDSVLNWTPLKYALEAKSWEAAEILLQNNANTIDLSLRHFNVRDPQMLASIIENGFVHFMTLILDRGSVENTFDEKYQLLHKAVIYGQEKLVHLLISRANNVKSNSYWVDLLILASGYGQPRVVQILVDRLGDDKETVIQYINTKDPKGRSAISEASRFGHAEVVTYLASKGGDIWARDGRKESPLHRSAGQGNLAVVEALLASVECNRVAGYINEQDKYGWTSVHRAAEDKHVAVLRVLISKGGDIWTRDEEGKTPLHIASERGHLEVVQELVKSLGDDKEAIVRYISSRDSEGRTPKEWTTDPERFRWSFEDECLAVAKWLDEVLKENSSS